MACHTDTDCRLYGAFIRRHDAKLGLAKSYPAPLFSDTASDCDRVMVDHCDVSRATIRAIKVVWVMGMFMILGAAISVAVTSYTIQVSDVADASIQGEVMGTLWGLRMLFDGITSLVGGGLILLAYSAPLALAAVAALLSWWGYTAYFMKQKNGTLGHFR